MLTMDLDLTLGANNNISLMQFDVKEIIRINVFKDRYIYNLQGNTIRLQGIKSDGNSILIPTTIISENILEFEVTEQLTVKQGIVKMQLLIFGENESLENSKIFSIYVNESLEIGAIVASDNDFLDIKNTLIKVDDWDREFAEKTGILEQLYTDRLNGVDSQLATINNTTIPTIINELIKGNANTKYKIVSCVLRNTGTGWTVLDDAVHTPLNVQYAVNDTDSIGLAYSFTAKTVGSVVCVPDETFVQSGNTFGASGGVSIADIVISNNKDMDAYVYYTGTTWGIMQGNIGITGATFSNGILTVTHAETDSLNVSCSCKSGSYLSFINNTGTTDTQIKITDFTGSLVTTPTSNMGIFFKRGTKKIINPNNVISASGNVWVLGIFEVE